MGTVTRQVAQKRNGKSYGLTEMQNAHDDLLKAVDRLLDNVEATDLNGTMPQKALASRLLLQSIEKAIKKRAEVVDARFLAHSVDGKFETGKIAITFPQTIRRNPRWKEIAIGLRRELDGGELDEKVYVTEITEDIEPSVSTRVKLTESA